MNENGPTHLDDRGRARMVDVIEKNATNRVAGASAVVCLSEKLLSDLRGNTLEKGDALTVARIAGIQAAKRTSDLIPLCHPLPLSHVSVDLKLADGPPRVEITAEARAHYKTGVEMEALTAATVAALTLYDMGKSVDREMVIKEVRLEHKSGGRRGAWVRPKQR